MNYLRSQNKDKENKTEQSEQSAHQAVFFLIHNYSSILFESHSSRAEIQRALCNRPGHDKNHYTCHNESAKMPKEAFTTMTSYTGYQRVTS